MKLKFLLIAGVCTAAIANPCSAQTVLGKHPADKALDGFFRQNTNADSVVLGIDRYSSVPLTNPAIQQPVAGAGIALTTNGSRVIITATGAANNVITNGARFSGFLTNTDGHSSWAFDGLNFTNLSKGGPPAFSLYDWTILPDVSMPLFTLNGQINLGSSSGAFGDNNMFNPFVNILNISTNGVIRAWVDWQGIWHGDGSGFTNIWPTQLVDRRGPLLLPNTPGNLYELDLGNSYYDWGEGKSFTLLRNGVCKQAAFEGGEASIWQINRADTDQPWFFQIDASLRIPANAQAGYLLTSDENGNAAWQPLSANLATNGGVFYGDGSGLTNVNQLWGPAAGGMTNAVGDVKIDTGSLLVGSGIRLYHDGSASFPGVAFNSDGSQSFGVGNVWINNAGDVSVAAGATLLGADGSLTLAGINYLPPVSEVVGGGFLKDAGNGHLSWSKDGSILTGVVPTARTLTLNGTTGEITVSPSTAQDLSANRSWTLGLPSTGTAGTYRSVTTDAHGRVTAGSNPTTFAGYGISDTSANLAAALTDPTGSGAAVFATSPTIITPTIASFANASHNHQDAAGGGPLDAAAIASGTMGTARLGSGSATANTVLHGNQAWSAVAEGDLSLSDVTTANASSVAHGLLPKLPNDGTKFLDGTGAFSTPPGGVPTSRTLTLNGTANQITVSPSGVQDLSANRSWTLSTPQDIGTASAPQFARLGLGAAADSTTALAERMSIAAATVSYGLDASNTTAATVNNQAYSPALHLAGNGWKTSGTAAGQPVEFRAYVVPVQGAVNPTGNLRFDSAVNNGSFGKTIDFSSAGDITTTGDLYVGGGASLIGPHGTSQTTLTAGTTGVGINGTSYVDLQLGGTTYFHVTSTGAHPGSDNAMNLGNNGSARWRDLVLSRQVTNDTQFGTGPAITFPNGGSGANANAAADMKICAPQSTGTGRGGAIRLQTCNSGSSGSTANALNDRVYISAKKVSLTGGSPTLVFNVSLASGKHCGLRIFATTDADDGTNFQANTDEFTVSAINKAGTVTTAVSSTVVSSSAVSSGTLTTSWTAVANGNGIDIKDDATTSLTPTTLATRWRVEIDTDDTALTVTSQ